MPGQLLKHNHYYTSYKTLELIVEAHDWLKSTKPDSVVITIETDTCFWQHIHISLVSSQQWGEFHKGSQLNDHIYIGDNLGIHKAIQKKTIRMVVSIKPTRLKYFAFPFLDQIIKQTYLLALSIVDEFQSSDFF